MKKLFVKYTGEEGCVCQYQFRSIEELTLAMEESAIDFAFNPNTNKGSISFKYEEVEDGEIPPTREFEIYWDDTFVLLTGINAFSYEPSSSVANQKDFKDHLTYFDEPNGIEYDENKDIYVSAIRVEAKILAMNQKIYDVAATIAYCTNMGSEYNIETDLDTKSMVEKLIIASGLLRRVLDINILSGSLVNMMIQ